MRRFSQRNSLVTLNEINVTPLLDLAFVLLIIFIITTPALEPGISMKLPVGGDARNRPRRQDRCEEQQTDRNGVDTHRSQQVLGVRGDHRRLGSWVPIR